MKVKFNRSIQLYYNSILVILLIAMIGGAIQFWKTGMHSSDSISAVMEASVQIDELKKRGEIGKVKRLVAKDRAREAISTLSRLESAVEEISESANIDGAEYDEFRKSAKDVKKQLTALIAVPEVTSLVRIFNNRITSFEEFVVENNWRTLTRMSKRIKSRLSASKTRQPGFMKYSRLKSVKRSILSDIRKMRAVTEGSILTQENKNTIYLKLNNLKTEIVMIDKYLTALKGFNYSYKNIVKKFDGWVGSAGPAISYNRLNFEKTTSTIIFGALGFMAFIILSLAVSIPVINVISKQGQREFEDKMVNVIRRGIISFEQQLGDSYGSHEFMAEMDNFHDYVHKRMSFGSVFQEAMPFSSVLLDSNLNVMWANSLFYENWGIDSNPSNRNDISWDFVQRFTNLGDEDPVIMAHKEGIAGIYQIQVKTKKDTETVPFEMYVSPVEYAGQTRIMVMFYPLRSMEETLHSQTKAILGPINKTIDALSSNTFDQDFRDKVQNEFEVAGIENVLDSFTSYNECISQEKHGLMCEMERLENNLYDQYKLNDDLKKSFARQGEVQDKIVHNLKETKESVINTVELRGKMEALYENSLSTVKSLHEDEIGLMAQTESIADMLEENVHAFKSMYSLKNDFKDIKGQIEEFKSRIIQQISHTSVIGRNNGDWALVENSLNKIKDDMKLFEKTLTFFGQIMTQSDVSLSKLELIMQQNEKPDLASFKERFESSRERIEIDLNNMTRLSQDGVERDETLINSLRDLFAVYKEGNKNLRFMNDLMDDSYDTLEMQSAMAEPPRPEVQV